MKRIILVDDHLLFRLGVKGSLIGTDIEIVGEAGNAEELFSLLPTVVADVVLLDIILPDMSGVEIAKKLRTQNPEIKILVLSAETSEDSVKELIELNVDGFVSKSQCNAETLSIAIESICNGVPFFGNDISHLIHNIICAKRRAAVAMKEFTERELEIIQLCHKGLLSKEIANQLNISPRTVDTHKNNIFKKLGITRTYDMVQYAIKNGIISFSN